MNKKIILCILLIVLVIGIIITISVINEDPNVKNFNEKISLIEKNYLKQGSFNKSGDNFVIISISDKEHQATVKVGKGNSFNSAFSTAKSVISNYIRDNNYNVAWLKLDIVDNISSKFQSELEEVEYAYLYRKGIIFEDSNREFVLTEGELNSNGIIDYENKTLDLDNLNSYLGLPSYEKITSVPTNIRSFTTTSYFCDEDNSTYTLYNSGLQTGTRVLNPLKTEYVNDVITKSTDYLFDMIQDDGKYIYGYDLITNKMSTDYNILRHAGATWSLIVTYDNDPDGLKKQKINSSIDYLKNFVVNDNNASYITDYQNQELVLGGNALSLLAMCEYTTAFADNQYLDLAEKLGDGILKMQQSDGHFVHALNTDFSVKEDYRTSLYDGEATFALCKLYGITKNEKYLQAAEKALNYFINNNYSIHANHWISYTVNEITKYVDNVEFYKFGLENFNRNISNFEDIYQSSPTTLELLVQCLALYNRITEKQFDENITQGFPIAKLTSLVQSEASSNLRSYIFPETAMYLKKPSKYLNCFFTREGYFDIRMDYTQHAILGYYYLNHM